MNRALLVVLLTSAALASAQERPWAAGVGKAEQAAALELFREGNSLFEQSNHTQALVRYREALQKWDHPAIRFNTAVVLINLDQPLEAWEHLEASLRFGEAPFGAETWKQALLYKKLLAGQVAEVEVRCEEPGAEVSLDGAPLFTGPGTAVRRLKPGAHQLVAKKEGFVTAATALQLAPGEARREELRLVRPQVAEVRLVRQFPTWLPWTVMGAGAAVALIGAPVLVGAQSSYDRYDQDLARVCPSGCPASDVPGSVVDLRQGAAAQNGVAIGLFAVGGAAVLTGAVLAVLNQPRPEPVLSFAPMVGPSGAGFVAAGAF